MNDNMQLNNDSSDLHDCGTECHSEITSESVEKNRGKLPAFGPCLAQSINQEEMSDKSMGGCFDRVEILCLQKDKKHFEENLYIRK